MSSAHFSHSLYLHLLPSTVPRCRRPTSLTLCIYTSSPTQFLDVVGPLLSLSVSAPPPLHSSSMSSAHFSHSLYLHLLLSTVPRCRRICIYTSSLPQSAHFSHSLYLHLLLSTVPRCRRCRRPTSLTLCIYTSSSPQFLDVVGPLLSLSVSTPPPLHSSSMSSAHFSHSLYLHLLLSTVPRCRRPTSLTLCIYTSSSPQFLDVVGPLLSLSVSTPPPLHSSSMSSAHFSHSLYLHLLPYTVPRCRRPTSLTLCICTSSSPQFLDVVGPLLSLSVSAPPPLHSSSMSSAHFSHSLYLHLLLSTVPRCRRPTSLTLCICTSSSPQFLYVVGPLLSLSVSTPPPLHSSSMSSAVSALLSLSVTLCIYTSSSPQFLDVVGPLLSLSRPTSLSVSTPPPLHSSSMSSAHSLSLSVSAPPPLHSSSMSSAHFSHSLYLHLLLSTVPRCRRPTSLTLCICIYTSSSPQFLDVVGPLLSLSVSRPTSLTSSSPQFLDVVGPLLSLSVSTPPPLHSSSMSSAHFSHSLYLHSLYLHLLLSTVPRCRRPTSLTLWHLLLSTVPRCCRPTSLTLCICTTSSSPQFLDVVGPLLSLSVSTPPPLHSSSMLSAHFSHSLYLHLLLSTVPRCRRPTSLTLCICTSSSPQFLDVVGPCRRPTSLTLCIYTSSSPQFLDVVGPLLSLSVSAPPPLHSSSMSSLFGPLLSLSVSAPPPLHSSSMSSAHFSHSLYLHLLLSTVPRCCRPTSLTLYIYTSSSPQFLDVVGPLLSLSVSAPPPLHSSSMSSVHFSHSLYLHLLLSTVPRCRRPTSLTLCICTSSSPQFLDVVGPLPLTLCIYLHLLLSTVPRCRRPTSLTLCICTSSSPQFLDVVGTSSSPQFLDVVGPLLSLSVSAPPPLHSSSMSSAHFSHSLYLHLLLSTVPRCRRPTSLTLCICTSSSPQFLDVVGPLLSLSVSAPPPLHSSSMSSAHFSHSLYLHLLLSTVPLCRRPTSLTLCICTSSSPQFLDVVGPLLSLSVSTPPPLHSSSMSSAHFSHSLYLHLLLSTVPRCRRPTSLTLCICTSSSPQFLDVVGPLLSLSVSTPPPLTVPRCRRPTSLTLYLHPQFLVGPLLSLSVSAPPPLHSSSMSSAHFSHSLYLHLLLSTVPRCQSDPTYVAHYRICTSSSPQFLDVVGPLLSLSVSTPPPLHSSSMSSAHFSHSLYLHLLLSTVPRCRRPTSLTLCIYTSSSPQFLDVVGPLLSLSVSTPPPLHSSSMSSAHFSHSLYLHLLLSTVPLCRRPTSLTLCIYTSSSPQFLYVVGPLLSLSVSAPPPLHSSSMSSAHFSHSLYLHLLLSTVPRCRRPTSLTLCICTSSSPQFLDVVGPLLSLSVSAPPPLHSSLASGSYYVAIPRKTTHGIPYYLRRLALYVVQI